MKLVTKIGIAILSALLIALMFFYLYFYYPLPLYEGEVEIEGLINPVEIYFDDYKVPHIYAGNEHDLFYAAGYITARERLFQMTITAAATEGRLSELFGEDAIERDIYLRTWGIPRMGKKAANKMHPDALEITQNFCKGINAYIGAIGNDLPVEFKMLGIKPLRWKPETVAGYERLMGHNLTFSWKLEIVMGQIAYMYGEEKLRELWPEYPEDHPIIVPEAGKLFGLLWDAMSEQDRKLRDMIQTRGHQLGSNSWVISGSRTASGKPILANDPHLPFKQPATWYEMHLVGGRFNTSGACLAGIPVPILGQNEACAWGFTNLMVDDVDFYVERINPDNNNQYWHDGEWWNMAVREEVIKIKGGSEKIITIRETIHGPIISDIHPLLKEGEMVVSMRWGGHEVADEIYAIMQLNLMKNWDDFTEAAKNFSIPGQNVVYADTAGNIGWRPFVKIPIRKGGKNLIPVSGESSEWDWSGFVPFDEEPYLLNPERGIIITANNKVIDDSYPYYISNFWEDPSRAKRIWEMLGDRENITVPDIKEVQTDVVSPFAREIAPYFVNAFDEQQIDNNNLKYSIELLESWGGNHLPNSAEAVVFNAAFLRLLRNIYADEMDLIGEKCYKNWLSLPSMSFKNIRFILRKKYSSWFDNVKTTDITEEMNEILRLSLVEAVKDIENMLGKNPANWSWGKLHKLTHNHFIGKKSALIDFFFGFNVGSFEQGGASTTVNNGEYLLYDPFDQVNGPSFRRIVDFSNLDETQFIIPTGQSGLPRSPHYDDQAPLYHSGKYRTTHFNESTIRSTGYKKLVLVPTK